MSSIVEQVLFVPRCAVCRRRFAVSLHGEEPSILCEECERSFQRAMRSTCARCGAPFFSCVCVPTLLRRNGVCAHIKLTPYSEEAEDYVMRRIVLTAKKRPLLRVMRRLGEELCVGVDEIRALIGEDATDAVIVPLPRSRKNAMKQGTDQAILLAEALSRATGIPYREFLHRTKHSHMQKTLSADRRTQNLQSIFCAEKVSPDTCVFLVDDVVTTGATMAAAAHALRRAGARTMVAVSLAHTKKKRNCV